MANKRPAIFRADHVSLFMPSHDERLQYKSEQDAKYAKDDYKKLAPVDSAADRQTFVALATWPNMTGLPMQAPLLPSDTYRFGYGYLTKRNGFKPSFAKQESRLFDLLSLPPIADAFFESLPDYLDRARFSATSITTMMLVDRFTEHWDMTSGNMLDSEKATRHFRFMQDESLVYCSRPSITDLMVSPIHSDVDSFNGKMCQQTPGFVDSLKSLHNLFKGLHNHANYIRTLQLHRIRCLDVDMVRAIAKSLPSLYYLGVFQCILIDFSKVPKLLDIAIQIKSGKKNFALDVYPNYHRGPMVEVSAIQASILPEVSEDWDGDGWDEWDGDGWDVSPTVAATARKWSSGVCWGKTPFRSYLGVYAIFIYQIWPKLAKHKMVDDLLRKGKAFRLYMERLPLPKYSLLRIIDALMTRDRSNLPTSDKQAIFVKEICAAMSEDAMRARIINIFAEEQECKLCHRTMIKLFFPKRKLSCLGCLLERYLDQESDHFKFQQRKIAAELMQLVVHGQPLWEKSPVHESLASLVALKTKGPDHAEYAHMHAAGAFALLLDMARAEQMQPDYSSGGPQHFWDVGRHSLKRRFNRDRMPFGPIDRLRADIQEFNVGQIPVGVSIPDYTTDQDAWEKMTEDEQATLHGAELRKRYNEIREEMRRTDFRDMARLRVKHEGLEAQLTELPSDNWDEIHSTRTTPEMWRLSREEIISRDSSWLDRMLIRAGESSW